jgi:hypothetical protein
VLDRNIKAQLSEMSEKKNKLSMKGIMTEFNVGKLRCMMY